MKRLLGVFVAVAVAAAALAAWGGAASGSAPEATESGSTQAQKRKPMPPLPREVRQRKRWIVGVKCDAPPFGYIDVRGKNAGFDIELAQWFARFAFGNKNRVTYECARRVGSTS
jgi:polar amino acid transport system substrate-binding protein